MLGNSSLEIIFEFLHYGIVLYQFDTYYPLKYWEYFNHFTYTVDRGYVKEN